MADLEEAALRISQITALSYESARSRLDRAIDTGLSLEQSKDLVISSMDQFDATSGGSVEWRHLMTRNVAGVDTASNRFHMYTSVGLSYGHTCDKHMGPADRRNELYTKAREMFVGLPLGTLVVIEEPIVTKNGLTTRLLCMAAGAIEAATYGLDLFVVWIDNNTWKREVCGFGNADKDYIAAWVQANMSLPDNLDQDFYDAAAICRYGEIRLAAKTN